MKGEIKKAKKRITAALANLKEFRTVRGENQKDFWERFGATQSGGSRYEAGRELPNPAAILVALYVAGIIDDVDLADANDVLGFPTVASAGE